MLNAMVYAPVHVKGAVEVRRNMRRARRHRKLRRRPARFDNRLRNTKRLPPSTKARWQSKLNILKQLAKVIPRTDVCVEDVQATTRPGSRRWNSNFSPIEVGKLWFYQSIKDLGFRLWLKSGFDTKMLRDSFGFKKTSDKAKECFESHAVDSWCLAASITGAKEPYTGLYVWEPIRLHRRQLHRFEPDVGGIRKPYGGTRSLGYSRGTLVRHIKHGLTYIGGTIKGKISLHSVRTGKRVTKGARTSDFRVLTKVRWRGTLLSGLKTGVSAAPAPHEAL